MNWTPSKSDIKWMEDLLSLGIHTWVGTFGAIDLNHEMKSYRWITQTRAPETNIRIGIVLKQLGWTVEKADKIVMTDEATNFFYNNA